MRGVSNMGSNESEGGTPTEVKNWVPNTELIALNGMKMVPTMEIMRMLRLSRKPILLSWTAPMWNAY